MGWGDGDHQDCTGRVLHFSSMSMSSLYFFCKSFRLKRRLCSTLARPCDAASIRESRRGVTYLEIRFHEGEFTYASNSTYLLHPFYLDGLATDCDQRYKNSRLLVISLKIVFVGPTESLLRHFEVSKHAKNMTQLSLPTLLGFPLCSRNLVRPISIFQCTFEQITPSGLPTRVYLP